MIFRVLDNRVDTISIYYWTTALIIINVVVLIKISISIIIIISSLAKCSVSPGKCLFCFFIDINTMPLSKFQIQNSIFLSKQMFWFFFSFILESLPPNVYFSILSNCTGAVVSCSNEFNLSPVSFWNRLLLINDLTLLHMALIMKQNLNNSSFPIFFKLMV